jgi:hypothetical protein
MKDLVHAVMAFGVALGIFVVLKTARRTSAEDSPRPQQIRVSDIRAGRVTLIGELGKPVGESVTIRGVWARPSGDPPRKDSSPFFKVTHIDGNILTTPIEIGGSYLEPVCQEGISGSVDNIAWSWRATANGRLKPPKMVVGESWEMVGFETAKSYTPLYSWIEGLQVPGHTPPPNFGTTFNYNRARLISPAKQNASQQVPVRSAPKPHIEFPMQVPSHR